MEIHPAGLLNMPVASLRAYIAYTTVAVKLETIVVLGDANSRTKDYYDLLTNAVSPERLDGCGVPDG
ncbi:MAG: hypothetical protein ACRD2Z_10625 [Thermoanaerobaculia bacterium]